MRPSAPSRALTPAVRAWLSTGIPTGSRREDAHEADRAGTQHATTMSLGSVADGHGARP